MIAAGLLADHLDDYVGHYRFGETCDNGEVSITRIGDKLYDAWADEEATQLLPGRYDMFFSREDGSPERFVRGKSGKVTGILYTLGDGEFEAERLDAWMHDTNGEGDEIRSMIGRYAKSIDGADTTLASQVWLDSPDASFIHALGLEHHFDQIKENVYRRLMGDTFSERKLTPCDISVHAYEDTAWAEFYWDFAAKFRKDGSPITTHGGETQIYRRTANGWRLVHVTTQGCP
jgi:hypothetical protein